MGEYQQLFNIILTFLFTALGWWLKSIQGMLNDLRDDDKAILDRLSSVEVMVAGDYLRRDEFQRQFSVLEDKLDKIFERLDSKADKNG